MKTRVHLAALSLAIAVNGAALLAAQVAMADGAERERWAQQAERVVVVGERPADALAAKHCTGRNAL
jgi:hypothetical protein